MLDSYISIDLETTGLNPKRDKIIEIGAVKVVHGVCTEAFETFVNPGQKLPERIVELTGITDGMLEGAPYIAEVLPELFAFCGEEPLLGHSILFDYSFLKKAAVDKKITFEKKAVDTLKIARKYLSDLEHRNLDFLCHYYGIPHHAHRASEDARATHELFLKLCSLFYQEEDVLFQPQKLEFKVKRDTPATKAQKERLYALVERHKIEIEFEVDALTRSEASRITDKFLARYGR